MKIGLASSYRGFSNEIFPSDRPSLLGAELPQFPGCKCSRREGIRRSASATSVPATSILRSLHIYNFVNVPARRRGTGKVSSAMSLRSIPFVHAAKSSRTGFKSTKFTGTTVIGSALAWSKTFVIFGMRVHGHNLSPAFQARIDLIRSEWKSEFSCPYVVLGCFPLAHDCRRRLHNRPCSQLQVVSGKRRGPC